MPNKNAPTVQSSNRVTVAVIRGTPLYKQELKQKLENIEKNLGITVSLERLLERGIKLVLEEFGETPPTGRLQGRYSEKS